MKNVIHEAKLLNDPLILRHEDLNLHGAKNPQSVSKATSVSSPASKGSWQNIGALDSQAKVTNSTAASACGQETQNSEMDTGSTNNGLVIETDSVDSLNNAEMVYQHLLETPQVIELIDQACNEGRDAGYQDGYAAGREQAVVEAGKEMETFSRLISGIKDAMDDVICAAEESSMEITLIAVSKILGDSIVTPEGISAIIKQAVAHLRDRQNVIIRLSHSDYDFVAGHEIFDESVIGLHGVEVVPDERVKLGGCMIDSASGSLDARIDIQYKRLCETLRKAQARSEK